MEEKVRYHVVDHIAWITLNRPEVHNAIDYDVMEQLSKHLSEAERDDSVKAVVLTGSGEKTFCSGGDLQKFHALYTKDEAHAMLSKMGRILYRIATFPKITVALLNGTAVGGGCELATSCDYRLAYPGNKIGFIQGTLGITTGWGGTTLLLERVPANLAMPLLYSGKKVTTEHGVNIGFITQLLMKEESIEDQVKLFLKDYIKLSSSVLKAYKSYYISRLQKMDIKSRMEQEVEQCARLWEDEEHHGAVRKFLKN